MVNKIKINDENLDSLVAGIKSELRKEKGLLLLGTFNQRISVLLKAPTQNTIRDLIFYNFRTNSPTRYSIHFNDPEEAWVIRSTKSNEIIFTFNIPIEIQKILASNDNAGKFLDVKQGFLSTLSFSVRYGDMSISLGLKIDDEWLRHERSNL